MKLFESLCDTAGLPKLETARSESAGETGLTKERIVPASSSSYCGSDCACHQVPHGKNVDGDVTTHGDHAAAVPMAADEMDAAALDSTNPIKALSLLDRFLWLWILIAMAVGIVLGYFVPNTARVLQQSEFVGVSAPIAVGLLVMMYPILCKIQFERLHRILGVRAVWRQLLFSLLVNWIFAPLLMLALSWATLPDRRELREGLILVGIARCIAMVLIWTGLAGGDNDYCAILVGVNSILQIVLFAPFAILYITKFVPRGTVPEQFQVSYGTVAASVGVFLGIPLGAAIVTRLLLRRFLGARRYETRVLRFLGPWSLIGLLFTIIVLFASQGRHVVDDIVDVARTVAPLILYFAITFFATLMACRKLKFTYPIAVAQSFTASSNNFELAIAVAISTYGIDSKQALAATVGPLIEIPVLLSLVYVFKVLRTRLSWPLEADVDNTDAQRNLEQVRLKQVQQKQRVKADIEQHANQII